MNLLLYSFVLTADHVKELTTMVGKPADAISLAAIENAADTVPDSEGWRAEVRAGLASFGFNVQLIDLRNWLAGQPGLADALAGSDVIWIGGGNTFYLRWILKATGADRLITARVQARSAVYAGISAGAIVAGPTLRHTELMDDPAAAPNLIWEGLSLTQTVVVPHVDNAYYRDGAAAMVQAVKADGLPLVALNDDQALIVTDSGERVV